MDTDDPGDGADAADGLAGRQSTMADVARRAQVSTATVSYFLSGRSELMRRVGAEAQERISLAVRELGYVQNKTARHLRLQRTERICVLLPRLGIPFADTMAQDIEAAAHRRGFATIVVTAADYDGFRHVVHEIEGGLADGLIADADGLTVAELTELLEPLERLGKACLMIHPAATGRAFSVVTHGRLEALKDVLGYIRDRGHRRIAYVQNDTGRHDPRSAAVRAFAAENGLPAPIVMEGAEARGRAVERAREIAALQPRPSIVVVESDFSAVAMIGEFQRLGLAVPSDIAVIGFGNAEEGFFCNPRLSTIGPVSLSMTEATEHLLDIITNRVDAGPRQFVVPWTLYPRESG
jgi:DNA-binding LacI/PurR family transcriptional regulator